MQSHKTIKNQGGQSLIEILIGLALIVLGLGSAVVLVYGGQLILLDRDNASTAKTLASEGISGATRIVKDNWNGVVDGNYGLIFASGTWQFSSSSDTTLDIFTRNISVATVGVDEREIRSVVNWSPDPLRNLSVELVTLVTNWTEVQDTGGDTGGNPPSGDWQNPRTLGSVDLGPGTSATDLDVKNKIVYLSAEASDSKKHDFYIINATNGQSPFIVSSTNTGRGLLGVDVAGNYAYTVGKDDSEEFQVIDVSNISAPNKISSLNLSGNADALTVFYHNNHAYIGRGVGSSEEFVVVDVSSPASPSIVGSYEVGDDVNDIYLLDDRAYLATDLGGAGLTILDVSNPGSISLLGQSYSSDTNSVFVNNPAKLLLGPAQDLYVVNAQNPESVSTLGTLSAGDSVNDIVTRDYLAFIASSNSNREFQVVNLSSSTNPTLHSYFNFSQVGSGIDYEDNIVYVSVRSNDALRIITSQ